MVLTPESVSSEVCPVLPPSRSTGTSSFSISVTAGLPWWACGKLQMAAALQPSRAAPTSIKGKLSPECLVLFGNARSIEDGDVSRSEPSPSGRCRGASQILRKSWA